MTPRKVHYWLDTGLLGNPIRWGRPGMATLLTFEQLLKVRTLQHLRDELDFSLQKVRRGLGWLLDSLFAESWEDLHFFRNGRGNIAATDGRETFALGSGQRVLEGAIPGLNEFLVATREDWEEGQVTIAGYPHLVSDAKIMGGSPVIVGSRIETAFIAHLAGEVSLADMRRLFPHVEAEALEQAARFEGVALAARIYFLTNS